MDPRFICAFCGREVRCFDDNSSVTVVGSFFFRGLDMFLDFQNEKFCKLQCVIDYIKHKHAWWQAEIHAD